MKRVSSRDNAVFVELRALAHSARARRRLGCTVLDGVNLVESYLARVGMPQLLAVSDQGLERPEIARLAAECGAVLVLSDALFAQASPVDTPSGVLARVRVPEPPPALPEGSCVVLDGVQDPGNAGAILRCAAAAGAACAVLGAGCAQAWSPRVLRAGMGAHFVLPVIERADPAALLAGYSGRILATVAGEGRSLFETDLAGDIAWLFGAEGGGLSAALRACAHDRVCIPMKAGIESLNVAAAAAICLFEQLRRRR